MPAPSHSREPERVEKPLGSGNLRCQPGPLSDGGSLPKTLLSLNG